MPRVLSAKGFAEFLILGPAKRSQIVRNIMKPESAEAKIITRYYSATIKIIRIYHERHNSQQYLREEIARLESQMAASPTRQGRSRIHNNLRALEGYMQIYGGRKREVVPRPRIYYGEGRVKVSASPDIAVMENGRLRLVKLGVRKQKDNPEVIRVMLRVIYRAAHPKLRIDPHDVVYFDIESAARIRGSHSDSDLNIPIENGYALLTKMCDAAGGQGA